MNFPKQSGIYRGQYWPTRRGAMLAGNSFLAYGVKVGIARDDMAEMIDRAENPEKYASAAQVAHERKELEHAKARSALQEVVNDE